MPAGGHIENDETPEEAAKRECKEETGLDVEIVGSEQTDLFIHNPSEGRMLKKPIALLLEEIPANPRTGDPAHQHMDFIFLARPLDEAQATAVAEKEHDSLRWFTKQDVEKLDTQTEVFANVKSSVLGLFS
jgi:8-oxo-dGTP pyrophosphatase MutT (NUDIX family)